MTEEPRRSNKVAKALDPSLVPLFDTLQTSSLSARVIRSEIVTTLQGESVAAKTIRRELFTTLWTKDWSPQSQSTEGLVLDVLAREITATICKSLRFETVEAREESIADSFDKTYDWIFSKRPKLQDEKALWPSFPEWLTSSTASRYWITGKPGSGKSTMMKYIIGHEHLKMHLKKWADPLPIIVTSYYAWHSGLTLQKSLEGLKRTLLLQAIYKNRELARVIAPRRWAFLLALRNGGHPLPPWEPWEIDESFATLLSECGKSMMLALFIDGLDEFETQPSEIIRLIQDMVADCPKGLKLCVASRPWNEFDDAFTDGPRLQMHLLTEQDMTNFMDSMLSGNRGFLEVQEVYPEEVAQLREEIVVKANGVFLWVSLVVRDLLLSVSEGASIADLQATLNALPPGLSSLYDAIWARIPPRNLVDASFMMQVLRAAHLPMRWLLMWVADEARTVRIDLNSRPAAGTWKAAAWKNLKRRLASRTRGILEITMESYTLSAGGGQVDFAHRTARDWAVQPHIWERICSAGKNIPDPYLALLRAEAIILSDERERSQMTYDRQWWLVTRVLWYASRVKDTPENSEDLVQALDDLNLAAVGLKWQPPADAVKQRHERWALPGWARDSLNTFPGMTGQFAIMPYIREKIRSQPRLLCQQLTRNTLGLLENVVFGFKYYLPPSYYTLDGFCPEVPLSQRLEAVQFLLKQGAKLSDARCHVGMVPLRDLVRRLATDQAKLPYHIEVSEEEKNYFAKILQCIDERDLKSKLKSMSVRVRFALVK
ncbi:hypothetical protein GQ53DRAFT_636812 [Thozetella sp. PMI_491]|nr:hypothetical protein GQ53DRAFT_636812 [Thozetella sp. PMI_491]